MSTLEKTYLYRVYSSGAYLGLLPNVRSEFSYPQEINSGMVQVTVEVGQSADGSADNLEAILDETGDPILDETSDPILEESHNPIVGSPGSNMLIANDNQLKIYEISDENPTGLLVFNGWITTNQANYGTDENIIITALSKACDLVDHIVKGSPYSVDVSQLTQDASAAISNSSLSIKIPLNVPYGQTWIPGAGVTNLAGIDLYLAGVGTDHTLTLKVYSSVADANASIPPLATAPRVINSTTPAVYRFAFSDPLAVTPGATYFFTIEGQDQISPADQAYVYYKSSNVYANGSFYTLPGSTWTADLTKDLYFATYSTLGATTAVFTTQDPTLILRTLLDNYAAEGGAVTYTTTDTQLTGLSVPYTFVSDTILIGIQKCLELSPYDWYWYIDPGSQAIHFKQTQTTATHKFIKGKHISNLKLTRTVDNVVNKVLFSGGDTGAGVNLLSEYINTDGVATHGRIRLARLSDGRVKVQTTADRLSNNELDYNADETNQTQLIIPASVYAISTINVGDTVGFGGFGSSVDNLIIQIARLVRHPDYIELTLGRVPPRQSSETAQAIEEIVALQTVNNPTTPS
jgi:hypothetical protein